MTTVAELEAYMDKIEERYSALYPNPKEGQRDHWQKSRSYIRRVKDGEVPGITLETDTPRATEALVGYRRVMGEELHPRRAILKRQQLARAAAAEREAAALPAGSQSIQPGHAPASAAATDGACPNA
jgi:hypothetical protein